MGSEMEKMLKRLDLENKSEEEANAALEEFFRNPSLGFSTMILSK